MEDSLIGSLPAELRNRIYYLVLPSTAEIVVNVCQRQPQPPREYSPHDIYALAATCKAIRRETMSIYYAENQWKIITSPFYLSAQHIISYGATLRLCAAKEIGDWFASIGQDSTRSISSLVIVIDGKFECLEPYVRCTKEGLKSGSEGLKKVMEVAKQSVGPGCTLEVSLDLPWRLFGKDGGYIDVGFVVADQEYETQARIDSITANSKRMLVDDNEHAGTFFKKSAKEMSWRLADQDTLGTRTKWYLRELGL